MGYLTISFVLFVIFNLIGNFFYSKMKIKKEGEVLFFKDYYKKLKGVFRG